LLDQNDVKINSNNRNVDVAKLNEADFSRLGDELRSNLSVAQVICRTN